MKIIIPMSGLGKRFRDVGYKDIKPLIIVDGKTIIEHVVSMFPGEHDFVFICNKDHLQTTNTVSVLTSIVPTCTIIGIDTHDSGPVHATTFAYQYIRDEEEVLISYCDYAMTFNLDMMLKQVRDGDYAGAVPSYTGFHPHLLHKKLYGGILADEHGRMLDYKEKHSFTEDPIDSHHSTGAYYFRSGREFKKYSDELLASDIRINGEAYTSMVYYLYLRDGKKILVPEVKHFLQWGTPEDLEEYEAWSRYFSKIKSQEKMATAIPQDREVLVRIPYKLGTKEYIKSHAYWESYFM